MGKIIRFIHGKLLACYKTFAICCNSDFFFAMAESLVTGVLLMVNHNSVWLVHRQFVLARLMNDEEAKFTCCG